MATPTLGQFLVAVDGFVQARNEEQLADYLALEPPFGGLYQTMIGELQRAYPKGREDALEDYCSRNLRQAKEGAEGATWTPFVRFMAQYLAYLRDVDADPSKYLDTYNLLSELQQRANSALTHASLGYMMLPIVVTNAKLVCRLAIGLDKRPDLIAHLRSTQPGGGGGDEGGQTETLPERAANIIRVAFTTCLNDRTGPLTGLKDGKPDGKKRGIYMLANLCLKILFQCRKTRNAGQIFENIYNQSPPLNAYPKREQVTYLYYLGRFLFQNSHFYRAQQALQYAYDESPSYGECIRQRRLILVFLIASNIILGRFPSDQLLNRPEAQGFRERFLPLCLAIRQGNLAAFRQHLAFDSPHADWFLHFRILLQLRNRCEVLVWRSLMRKTFILGGVDPTRSDPSTNRAPTLDINLLVIAFTFLERQALQSSEYTDPDFEGVESEQDDSDNPLLPDTLSVESMLMSLIQQGLLRGYVSHDRLKYAVNGTKKFGSAVNAGFAQPWAVLSSKGDDEVPGWKKPAVQTMGSIGGQKAGAGMIINLSGARPVGAFG